MRRKCMGNTLQYSVSSEIPVSFQDSLESTRTRRTACRVSTRAYAQACKRLQISHVPLTSFSAKLLHVMRDIRALEEQVSFSSSPFTMAFLASQFLSCSFLPVNYVYGIRRLIVDIRVRGMKVYLSDHEC